MPARPNRVRLTKSYCDRAIFEGRHAKAHDVRWDSVAPGLGLRVFPSGRRSWLLRYRDKAGTNRRMSLGEYGRTSIEAVRKLARAKLAEIDSGIDPLEEKRRAQQAKQDKPATVDDLCEAFEDRYLPNLKDQVRPKRVLTLLRERWGKRPAASILRADVAALHGEIGKTAPYEANRIVAQVHRMWKLADVWGLVPEGHPNPARGIDKFKENKRDRWVKPAEIPALLDAILAYDNAFVRGALVLYLLTGCRKGELLSARWEHVDLQRKELRIPTPKQGKPHVVPLSAPAMKVLEELPRLEDNPHVFPGARKGAPLVNIDKCWREIRKTAKLPDVRLHDLRRTVGSWLATDGESLLVIGKALGHTQQSTTAIYARLQDTSVRDALERHGERIAEHMSGGKNVDS